MSKQVELLDIFSRISIADEKGHLIDVRLARIIGWTEIRFIDLPTDAFKGGKTIAKGKNPVTGVYEDIPRFTTDLSAAVSYVPDKWVEGYNRRFDGSVRVSCHPRGDLGLMEVNQVDSDLVIGMISVAIQARLQELKSNGETQ